jgi:hypothetical protein
LLFGGIEALIRQVAAAGIRVPEYLMLMTPYLATLGVMVWQGIRGKVDADAPAALGQALRPRRKNRSGNRECCASGACSGVPTARHRLLRLDR